MALAVLVGALGLASPAWARNIYIVNSNGDGADANTADGVCADGSGKCTLRAAIQQANATPGADATEPAAPTRADIHSSLTAHEHNELDAQHPDS